jgi:hypothetical protein
MKISKICKYQETIRQNYKLSVKKFDESFKLVYGNVISGFFVLKKGLCHNVA